MNRQKSIVLLTIPVLIFLFSLGGCKQRPASPADTAIDSVLSASTNILFSNPKKADSLYAAMQHDAADSATFQRLNLFRASALAHMGDTVNAERLFAEVQAWCNRTDNSGEVEGQLWNHRGVLYAISGDWPHATEYYQRSFDVLNRSQHDSRLIATTVNLADMYQQQGALAEAANYYRYALFLSDSIGNDLNRASIYSGLALIYTDLYDFEQAHEYFDRAAGLLPQESATTQLYYYFTLGNCLYFEQRLEESLRSFEKAQALNRVVKSADFELKCEGNIGELYLMMDNLPEARRHLARADSINRATHLLDLPAQFYLQSLQADLAIAEGRRVDAHTILLNTTDIKGFAPLRYQLLHYRRLQHYAEKQQRWQTAYAMQNLAQHYADTLRSLQAMNSVAEMALRYERDTTLMNQRLELANYRVRNARQQMFIAAGVAATVVLLLVVTIIVYFYRRHTHRRLQQQMNRITELRMDVVRNRVSPHYIFNVLGTVLPRLSSHPDVSVPLNLLIDVLRGNLLTSGKVAVSLRDELALVRNFVQLHGVTKGEYPRVEWNVAPELAESTLLVPSMSIEIPVENALKHAFPSPDADSLISVCAAIADAGKNLHITISDNGQGYNPGRVRPTGRDTGTGLRLITRTIDILNKTNPHPASISIKNKPYPAHGTMVHLVIPTDYDYSISGIAE